MLFDLFVYLVLFWSLQIMIMPSCFLITRVLDLRLCNFGEGPALYHHEECGQGALAAKQTCHHISGQKCVAAVVWQGVVVCTGSLSRHYWFGASGAQAEGSGSCLIVPTMFL